MGQSRKAWPVRGDSFCAAGAVRLLGLEVQYTFQKLKAQEDQLGSFFLHLYSSDDLNSGNKMTLGIYQFFYSSGIEAPRGLGLLMSTENTSLSVSTPR